VKKRFLQGEGEQHKIPNLKYRRPSCSVNEPEIHSVFFVSIIIVSDSLVSNPKPAEFEMKAFSIILKGVHLKAKDSLNVNLLHTQLFAVSYNL
jgi:hypothetical protein